MTHIIGEHLKGQEGIGEKTRRGCKVKPEKVAHAENCSLKKWFGRIWKSDGEVYKEMLIKRDTQILIKRIDRNDGLNCKLFICDHETR